MFGKQTKILAAAIAIIVIFVIYYAIKQEAPQEQAADTTNGEVYTPENNPTESPTTKSPSQVKAPSAPSKPAVPQTGIYITSPAAGEKWVIGQNNTIKWSEEGGFKGFIYLANAGTKEIVGWINSETGPHQTSYVWDARDLFISRYNPNKQAARVGNYIIGVGFESKKQPAISGVFEIIYPSAAAIDNYNIVIKDYAATPPALKVKKGSKLIFFNQDQITHHMQTGTTIFPVAPNESFTFNTDILFPGTYEFYSEQYPTTTRVIVTVQSP